MSSGETAVCCGVGNVQNPESSFLRDIISCVIDAFVRNPLIVEHFQNLRTVAAQDSLLLEIIREIHKTGQIPVRNEIRTQTVGTLYNIDVGRRDADFSRKTVAARIIMTVAESTVLRERHQDLFAETRQIDVPAGDRSECRCALPEGHVEIIHMDHRCIEDRCKHPGKGGFAGTAFPIDRTDDRLSGIINCLNQRKGPQQCALQYTVGRMM